ncbi:MAG: ABC transporter permease [Actinobacteria bacterium]|jgi:peptide/nickel transport system permease protein|nr:ABC transporter permease [Actinomycetota bacterium]
MTIDTPPTLEDGQAPPATVSRTGSRSKMRQFRRNFGAMFGLTVIVVVCLMALFAPWVAPYDPTAQVLLNRNRPPFWMDGGTFDHVLGTDQLGRDLFSRIVYGARISLFVGIATVLIQTSIGVTVGLIAGYRRGWVDTLFMRIADVWLAIPFLVLAIAVAVILGPGVMNTVLVLGLVGWVTYARVVRAEVLTVRERDYVLAARSIGTPALRIVRQHIVPNVMASVLVVGTLQISRMIIAEASLSFLGLGVQPPNPAWGSMISEGRDRLGQQWWLATMPGLALMLTTLGINLLGDSMRDILDPKLGPKEGGA